MIDSFEQRPYKREELFIFLDEVDENLSINGDRSGLERRSIPPAAFLVHILAGVNLAPDFFPQTLELQDRQGSGIICRQAKDMNNLLGNGSMFSVCACLNLSVEPIRHFLDIQGGHLFLQNGVIMEECKVPVKRPNEIIVSQAS